MPSGLSKKGSFQLFSFSSDGADRSTKSSVLRGFQPIQATNSYRLEEQLPALIFLEWRSRLFHEERQRLQGGPRQHAMGRGRGEQDPARALDSQRQTAAATTQTSSVQGPTNMSWAVIAPFGSAAVLHSVSLTLRSPLFLLAPFSCLSGRQSSPGARKQNWGRAAPSLRHRTRLGTAWSCLTRFSRPWAS